jgi:hypothetical protein
MPGYMHPDDGMATPMVISETMTHIVVAIEIPKASLQRHQRFLEILLTIARRSDG